MRNLPHSLGVLLQRLSQRGRGIRRLEDVAHLLLHLDVGEEGCDLARGEHSLLKGR